MIWRAVFNCSVENYSEVLWFCFMLCDYQKNNSSILFDQSDAESKSVAFSAIWTLHHYVYHFLLQICIGSLCFSMFALIIGCDGLNMNEYDCLEASFLDLKSFCS